MCNEQSEKSHCYETVDETVKKELSSFYEGDKDDVTVSDCGNYSFTYSEFQVKTDPENRGILLRRRSDQEFGRQAAKVYIDGTEVSERLWYFADRNSIKRWLDDEFMVPGSYTEGKTQITVRIEPLVLDNKKAWNEFRYWVFSICNSKLN